MASITTAGLDVMCAGCAETHTYPSFRAIVEPQQKLAGDTHNMFHLWIYM